MYFQYGEKEINYLQSNGRQIKKKRRRSNTGALRPERNRRLDSGNDTAFLPAAPRNSQL